VINNAAACCGDCQVVCERTAWDGGYIGINSFGFGGSNVHVLLRSSDPAPSASATPHAAAMSARLVTCAGRSKEGVEATLAEALQHPADVEMQCLLQSSVGDLSPVTHPYRGAALVNTATSRQTVEVHPASSWVPYGLQGCK